MTGNFDIFWGSAVLSVLRHRYSHLKGLLRQVECICPSTVWYHMKPICLNRKQMIRIFSQISIYFLNF